MWVVTEVAFSHAAPHSLLSAWHASRTLLVQSRCTWRGCFTWSVPVLVIRGQAKLARTLLSHVMIIQVGRGAAFRNGNPPPLNLGMESMLSRMYQVVFSFFEALDLPLFLSFVASRLEAIAIRFVVLSFLSVSYISCVLSFFEPLDPPLL